MCSPVKPIPSNKEPPTFCPCIPIQGPKCFPCDSIPIDQLPKTGSVPLPFLCAFVQLTKQGLRMRTAATVLCSSLLFTLLRRRRLPRHSIQSSSKHPVTGQLRLTVFNSGGVEVITQDSGVTTEA
ncbi:unnamed protein product [Arctia plantaginis]|uniref:Uncharacterized protein n=1 Tax=Arctia plantaginis TaxID=874455 RepID=A0A8S1A2Q1_ARCPL|nr:unnamed protein product [Arctia plantaginis]